MLTFLHNIKSRGGTGPVKRQQPSHKIENGAKSGPTCERKQVRPGKDTYPIIIFPYWGKDYFFTQNHLIN